MVGGGWLPLLLLLDKMSSLCVTNLVLVFESQCVKCPSEKTKERLGVTDEPERKVTSCKVL
jgi:hypothetical protein